MLILLLRNNSKSWRRWARTNFSGQILLQVKFLACAPDYSGVGMTQACDCKQYRLRVRFSLEEMTYLILSFSGKAMSSATQHIASKRKWGYGSDLLKMKCLSTA